MATLVALVALGAAVAMAGLLWAVWSRAARADVERAERARLEVLAATIAAALPGEAHERITRVEDSDFQVLRERLRQVKEAAGLQEDLYTVRRDGDIGRLVVMTSARPSPGERQRLFAGVEATLVDGVVRSRRRAEDEGGARVSAWAPVRTADGHIVAALVVEASTEEADTAAQRSVGWYVLCALVLGAVLAPLGALVFFMVLARPLGAMADRLRHAADGDLGDPPPDPGIAAELGALASAFGKLQGGLGGLVTEMGETVVVLDQSIRTLKAATTAQGQTISQQAATLQQTSVTAQEIKQTSLLAAQRAEEVLQVADRAEELGRSGETTIAGSLETLRELRAQVGVIGETIHALDERSRQIGGITLSVKDLADQSNILALNAAIEAVRSGEHGRSFAVVAREIRALADQSIQATKRVREILEDIAGAVTMAVSIAETGGKRMEGGLEEMQRFGESFRELAQIVRDDAAAVRQIAAAVGQQNVGVSQIFAALTDQTRMMDETVSRVASTQAAATALEDASRRVAELARFWRVGGGPPG